MAETYSLRDCTATVRLAPGAYTVERLLLPRYEASTGTIRLQGEDKDSVILEGTISNGIVGAGAYSIDNLTIRYRGVNDAGGQTWNGVSCGSGNQLTVSNCHIHAPLLDGLHYRAACVATWGATIIWRQGNTVEGHFTYVWQCTGNAVLRVAFDTTLNVVSMRNGPTAFFQDGGLLLISRINSNYAHPVLYGTATGPRYQGSGGAICRVVNGTEESIPGGSPGTLSDTALYLTA